MPRNKECQLCPLYANAKNPCLWGTGPAKAELMIVGQNPGKKEDLEDAPFVGPSGAFLNEVLSSAGILRENVYVSNAVKCYTPGNAEPPLLSVNACRTYLAQEIEAVSPRYIVALGGTALKALTGSGGVTKKMGQILSPLAALNTDAKVLPTFHPAYILKGNTEAKEDVLRTFAQVKRLLSGDDLAPKPEIEWINSLELSSELTWMEPLLSASTVAFDIETNAREPEDPLYRVWLIGLDDGEKVRVFGPNPAAVLLATSILKMRLHDGKTTVGHNSTRFDLPGLFSGDELPTLQDLGDDTIFLARLGNENRSSYALERLAQIVLGQAEWKGMVTWDWFKDDELTISWPTAVEYNAADCRTTLLLYKELETVKDDPQLLKVYNAVYKPTTAALRILQRNGVYVLQHELELVTSEITAAKEKAKAELQSMYAPVGEKPFNPNSAPQVAHVLYNVLGLKPRSYSAKTGAPSTKELDVKMLAGSGGPVAQLFVERLLRYRQNAKLLTYLADYKERTQEDPRIYPSVSMDTVTARTNCYDPNLQNVPRDKRIRRVIGAPPGRTFMQADYSQLELRVAAHVAGERAMQEAFRRGDDLHLVTASRNLGIPITEVTEKQRTEAGKVPNFQLLYCATTQTFIDTSFKDYDVMFSFAEADAIRNGFYRAWPDLEPWYSRCADEIKETGQIRSITGQIRRLPVIRSGKLSDQVGALREGINFCVSNPASHIAEIALWKVVRKLYGRRDALVVGFIHDALQLEVDDTKVAEIADLVRYTMEEEVPKFLEKVFGITLSVPLVADIGVGPSWGQQAKWQATTILQTV